MTFIDIIGTIGGVLLAYSNIPQIVMFFRSGHAEGISKASTWLWLVGMVCRVAYMIHVSGYDTIVLAPYGFASICCVITFYYLYFPKEPV